MLSTGKGARACSDISLPDPVLPMLSPMNRWTNDPIPLRLPFPNEPMIRRINEPILPGSDEPMSPWPDDLALRSDRFATFLSR